MQQCMCRPAGVTSPCRSLCVPGAFTMGYTTQGIRNIALVGSAGGGKTLLLEGLLLQAGAIRSKGSLQRGATVSDSIRRKSACSIPRSRHLRFRFRRHPHQPHRHAGLSGFPRSDPVGPRSRGGGRHCRECRRRRRHPDTSPDGVRARARVVSPRRNQQDRQPRRASRRGVG